MGRIGYLADEIETSIEDIKKIAALPNFKIKGMFSHMSTADAADKTYSHQQEDKYNAFYEALTKAGVYVPMRTLANSASIMELPASTLTLSVLESFCTAAIRQTRSIKNSFSIKPVMSVKANIIPSEGCSRKLLRRLWQKVHIRKTCQNCDNRLRLCRRLSSPIFRTGQGYRKRRGMPDCRQYLYGPVHDRRFQRAECKSRRRGHRHGFRWRQHDPG